MKKLDLEKSVIYSIDNIKDAIDYFLENNELSGYYLKNENIYNRFENGVYSILEAININTADKYVSGNKLQKEMRPFYIFDKEKCARGYHKYFIPEDKAVFVEEEKKPKELKYKPYKSIAEFPFFLNGGIEYKRMDSDDVFVTIITGYSTDEKTRELKGIGLGAELYPVEKLLEEYCYKHPQRNEWCRFGVAAMD